MHPDEIPSAPVAPGGPAKRRILLPIVGAVLALTVFLALFWNEGRHGKKGHGSRGGAYGQRDPHNPRGGAQSPVGGQYEGGQDSRDGRDREGSSDVTQGAGSSPVGGRGSASGSRGGKGENWWYQEGGKSAGGDGDHWWYQEKSGSGTSSERSSPVGGNPKAEAKEEIEAAASPVGKGGPSRPAGAKDKESGPDDSWWHD